MLSSFLRASSATTPPLGLRFRSSRWFIGTTAFIATFTDGFLYGAVVPVLPFSLVKRSGVAEEDVQFWLSVMLMTFGATLTFGSPIAGWAVARTSSRKLLFLASLALAFFSTLLFCFGRAIWLLVVARALQGLAAPLINTASLAMVADHVEPEEIGAWIGFVLSGMNLGLLIAPFLAGAIYDQAGHYVVFIVILSVIIFEFILRLLMIERRTAAKWLSAERTISEAWSNTGDEIQRDFTQQEIISPDPESSSTMVSSEEQDQVSLEADECTALLPMKNIRQKSWFSTKFPAMSIILRSPRLRAAYYGGFTHTMLITSFDAILPLFVYRTFGWKSTGGGLIFLAITIPSIPGALIGAISDRYGTRKATLFGFAIATPGLALMALIKDDNILNKILLCVFLAFVGIGLNFILSPLAADVFDEASLLAETNPEAIDKAGAFAQAYSMFSAALGVASVVGPGLSGFIYESTDWQVTAGMLTLMCAVGSVFVFRHTGNKRKQKIDEGAGRNMEYN